MPGLFDTFQLRDVTLRNRVVVSPMCQYSCVDGHANDWHLVHLGSRAVGGAALVMVEATAVSPAGRGLPGGTRALSGAPADALPRVTPLLKSHGANPPRPPPHPRRQGATPAPSRRGQT